MPPLPFTQPWATAFRDAINADADYREAAKRWTWPLALVLDPVPELGYAEGAAVRLELERGHCHDATAVPSADPADVTFALRAPYDVWKRIVRGELEPVSAVMRGQLALARGSLATLMMHARAATALVAVARKVATEFPDERPGAPRGP